VSSAAEGLLRQAAALHRQGRRAEGIAQFQRVLAEHPHLSEGWYELGYLHKADGRHEEALAAFAEALARGVDRAEEVHLNRAVIYSDMLRRDDEAERELLAAIALAPGYVPALLNLGNLHEERGRREAAMDCYRKVLSGEGNDARHADLRHEALARLAILSPPASLDDPMLARLDQAATEAARGNPHVRANLLFSLGRSYERLGDFDRAFDGFSRANRSLLRQSGRSYDRAQAEQQVESLMRAFTAEHQGGRTDEAGAGAEPLFVCGMFRSGSTLIEQVLGAHPRVTAGGELDYLLRLALGPLAPFPASMARVDTTRDAELAAGYRAHLAKLYPEGIQGRYITDKRPDNFSLIGLVKRMFPRAKIIHTVRHPLDTGLSVFTQHLNLRIAGYSADLGDIGHHFGQYRRLMAHWKALYPDDILDFDYDVFVRDPRPALERLLAFLGLPWDDGCLQFHTRESTVKTASYWQVRQPLNSKASGRWRQYGAHLDPLRAALAQAGVELPVD
jgi:tetratricopeptide (TPR) repeat protein